MQAIGSGQPDGLIELKAYCNPDESVIIEVSNNELYHSTGRSGTYFCAVLHDQRRRKRHRIIHFAADHAALGGSIALKSNPAINKTSFILTFP